jgi:PTH1 family peptidyl-tRNA hydrolase
MSASIALVVGLGNPGQQYQYNRHNAGVMFLQKLCDSFKGELRAESKFHGKCGRIDIAGHEVRLLFPTTYMNKSGMAVAALSQYYKIAPEQILVAYDELDLPIGTTRLKKGGGAGGHNGVRDILSALGSPDFLRLRFGIAHPGNASKVIDYVLNDFSRDESISIEKEFDKALAIMPLLVEGKPQVAMNELHTDPAEKAAIKAKQAEKTRGRPASAEDSGVAGPRNKPTE